MALDVGTLAGLLDLDTTPFDRKLKGTDETAKREGRRSGKSFGDGFGDESDRSMSARFAGIAGRVMRTFGGGLAAAAKPAAMVTAAAFVGPFLAQVAAGLASGAVHLAQGLGAGLALLPAALLAGGLAAATFKVALSGVGDALKAGLAGDTEKFNEALKGMPPSARAVAREVVGLRGALDGLKDTVQESFFASLVGSVRPLAERYLPMIRSTMSGIAAGFGDAGRQTADFLTLPTVSADVATALGSVHRAVGNVTGGLPGLVAAFLPLVTVGASFLPGLTAGFDGATTQFAAFMREAERTGRLREFISDGLSAIGDLVTTGGTLVSIFRNIGSIGRTVFDAIGLKTGNILGTVDRLTGSFDKWLKSAEGTKALAAVLKVAGTILAGFRDTALRVARLAGDVLGPLLPDAGRLVMALSKLRAAVLDVALDALEPILKGLGAAVGFVVPLLASLAEVLADNKPVLQGIGIAIITLLIPAFVSWAISAGIAAASTLLLLAPIILVGAGIAALAALVIIHWDTIVGALKAAFNWVKDNWPLLLLILTGPFGAAAALVKIHWDSIVDFVRKLPGRITAAASGMWDGIYAGLAGIVDRVWDQVRRLVQAYNSIPFAPNVPVPGSAKLGRMLPKSHTGEMIPGGAGNEVLRILQGGEEVLARNDPRNQANAGSGLAPAGGGAAERVLRLLVRLDGTGLLENLRYTVRTEGGGDVQLALGA